MRAASPSSCVSACKGLSRQTLQQPRARSASYAAPHTMPPVAQARHELPVPRCGGQCGGAERAQRAQHLGVHTTEVGWPMCAAQWATLFLGSFYGAGERLTAPGGGGGGCMAAGVHSEQQGVERALDDDAPMSLTPGCTPWLPPAGCPAPCRWLPKPPFRASTSWWTLRRRLSCRCAQVRTRNCAQTRLLLPLMASGLSRNVVQRSRRRPASFAYPCLALLTTDRK